MSSCGGSLELGYKKTKTGVDQPDILICLCRDQSEGHKSKVTGAKAQVN